MRKPSATLIGAFVLGALAVVVAGVLFFGGAALRNKHVSIVSFFDGSVAGLRVGAPVTFRGVPVGEVKSMGVRVNPRTERSIIQVNMDLMPQAVTLYGAPMPSDGAFVPSLVKEGLTAQLVKQSFVTGLLSVELSFRPGAEVLRFGDATLPEVPTVPGDLESLTKQLQMVDIVAVLDSMQRTFESVNAVLRDPALKQTLDRLPGIATSLERTLDTAQREVGAGSASLQETLAAMRNLATNLDRESGAALAALRQTLDKADATLDDAQALLDPRSHSAMQVQRAIDDLATTSARLRNLAERVDRDPAVLVRGR